MAGATQLLLKDPLFEKAVAYAKGVAKIAGASELTIELLAAGLFVAAARREEESETTDRKWEVIENVWQKLGFPADFEIIPLTAEKLPLAADLRKLISESSDYETFLSALVSHLQPNDALNSPAFELVLSYSSGVSRRLSADDINAEHFAVGALAAFLDGGLIECPAVSAHVASNAKSLSALISDRGWARAVNGGPDTETLPLANEFSALLKGKTEDTTPVMLAISSGLAAGAKIIAKEKTAYHEAGHAVVSSVLRPELPIREVNVIDEGSADGVTKYDPTAPYWKLGRREDFLITICVMLAGATAEQIKFGHDEIDTGSRSDIEKATAHAWRYITEWGLDDEFGPINLSSIQTNNGQTGTFLYDEAQKRLQAIMKNARQRARQVLEANWMQVEALAQALIQKKRLIDDEIGAVMIEKGLEHIPGTIRAISKPVDRKVVFAQEPGLCMTAEGPVRYNAGDAILTGSRGEQWPVALNVFEASYRPLAMKAPGEEGVYRKIPRKISALRLSANKRVDLSNGRGILVGRAGDFIVDYGNGDLAVVAGDIFLETYEADEEAP